MGYAENVSTTTATVANGQTKSAAVALVGETVLGIVTPAAIDGTSLTFEVSADGTTYVPLYDSTGTQVSVSVTASHAIYLDPAIFAAWRYVKLVGTTSTADRAYTLLKRPV